MSKDGQHAPDLPIDPDLIVTADRMRTTPGHGAPQWDIVLVIAAGGAIGGGARWLLNEALPRSAEGFPTATFIVNILGCLLLGVLMVYLVDVWTPHRYARPFLGIGILGGFTTFSAYMGETADLLRTGHVPVALGYLFATVILGLLATWMGIAAARKAAGIGSEST